MEEEYSSTTEEKLQTSKSISEIVTVSIDDYKLEEGRMKKHVVYIITGQDSSGVFTSQRRYKEFKCLRTMLVLNWPTIPIPKLPKKKMMGNMSKDLIHKRKKLLDYFIGKVVSHIFVFKSEAFQLFIRGPADFVKTSRGVRCFNYEEILQSLQLNFSHTESFVVSNNNVDFLNSFCDVLEESLKQVKKMKKLCKKAVLTFYRYEGSLAALTTSLSSTCQYFHPNREPLILFQAKATNPYKVLLDWARREVVEIESVLESIEKKSYLESILAKSHARRLKQQQELESFQSGKKSLMQRLKKNDEETGKELEMQVASSDKEIQALQEIIRLATDLLVNFQLPSFRQKEAEKFERTIRCYSGVVIRDLHEFVEYYSKVLGSIRSE
jgi:hypothetical protein